MIQFPTLSVMQKNRAAVAAELRRLLPKMEGFRTAKPLPIGVSAIDSHLPDGGLQGGALHEIVPEDGATPAAVGFMVALLGRISANPLPTRAALARARAQALVGRGWGWGSRR